MKLAPILVLCLAVSLHQATAKPLSFDAIGDGIRQAGSVAEGIAGAASGVASGIAGTAGDVASGIAQGASGAAQGFIGTANGVVQGVIGVGTGIASGIADKAGSIAQDISEKVKKVQNKVLKGALQQAQNTLQKVQDSTRGALQASQVAAKKISEGLIEVENKKNELIQDWADKATEKLANASPETQEKGQELINGFVDKSAESVAEASNAALEALDSVQQSANATAEKYHESMNKLIEQVGKCSEIKASQIRDLKNCADEIRKDLAPLASAPGDLAAVKAKIIKAAGVNILKDVRIQNALRQFRDKSKQVEAILDHLVAQDQANQEQQPQEDEQQGEDQGEDVDAAEEEPSEDEAAEEEPEE